MRRELGERGKLEPLLRFVPQNPSDRTGFIIEANDKILPAGNDQRVIRPIVSGGVVMEPISRRWIHELTGIIASRHHRRTDDFGQVPSLEKGAGQVHFHNHAFVEIVRVCFEKNSRLTRVDIMVKIHHPIRAIISQDGNGAIEVNTIQVGPLAS